MRMYALLWIDNDNNYYHCRPWQRTHSSVKISEVDSAMNLYSMWVNVCCVYVCVSGRYVYGRWWSLLSGHLGSIDSELMTSTWTFVGAMLVITLFVFKCALLIKLNVQSNLKPCTIRLSAFQKTDTFITNLIAIFWWNCLRIYTETV